MVGASQKLGRVAMLYPHGAFSSLRGVADAACLLADAGYEVDVFYRRTPDFDRDLLDHPGVHAADDKPAVFTKGPVRYPALLRRGRNVYRRFVTAGPHVWWRRHVLLPELRRRHATLPYVCIMGLDWHGLIAAGPIAAALGVPLVYWSLELLFRDDVPADEGDVLKGLEAEWSRRAAFTIIQDKWRAEALVEENGVDSAGIVLVPNAPCGRARRSSSRLLRDRHGIAETRRIAICTGMLRPWAMSKEVVEAAGSWSPEWVLYMQSKARPEEDESPYSGSVLRSARESGAIMGLNPVPRSEFDTLLDAADVGIALYNPLVRQGRLDRNMQLMGYSSGKLADYLRCGLPVITTGQLGIRDLVQGYECGVCVDDPAETSRALQTIAAGYERYSANACRAFDEELELGKHFAPVIGRLNDMRLDA